MNALITFALRQRVLMFVVMIVVFIAGAAGFMKLNIEAYPDPVPPLVDIVTQSTGQSAEEWVGEFGNLQEAIGRLEVVVPLTIVLICLLLYINFGSLTDMLLAASVIPMALIGGIFTLYFTGTPFSVSAAIGFVALFGISAMDGIIVLTWFNQALEGGMDRTAAILRTCHVQFRPVMMTCIVAAVGLGPAAMSNGIGSQVQKPLALVVVGGIMLAPVLILIVLPVLIDLFSRRAVEQAEPETPLELAE
jgi:cobalt-zinc-cadmium resistance protein CzcA